MGSGVRGKNRLCKQTCLQNGDAVPLKPTRLNVKIGSANVGIGIFLHAKQMKLILYSKVLYKILHFAFCRTSANDPPMEVLNSFTK